MKRSLLTSYFILLTSLLFSQTKILVPYPSKFGNKPLDGRLLLLISTNKNAEPRFQISDGPQTQQVFGINVDNWKPGETKTIDAKAFGYPVENIKQLKNGTYYVQVLLHKYETFKRKDGHTIKLPMDRGEGQHWNEAPGNLYNKPLQLRISNSGADAVTVTLDTEIPPIEEPKDTKYIKHIKIQSKLLTEF